MWFDISKEIAEKHGLKCVTISSLNRLGITYDVVYLMDKNSCPYVTGGNKYAMFIKWDDGDNIAIVIGQNPSVCKTIDNCFFHLDRTNWNIIQTLNIMGYNGYIMINTFACIETKGTKIETILPQTQNIKIAKDILNHRQISDKPIILACTKDNNIAYDFMQFLKQYLKTGRIKKVQDNENNTITHFATLTLYKGKRDLSTLQIIKLEEINVTELDVSKNTCKWDIT